jgi:GntR family transcriptional regulator
MLGLDAVTVNARRPADVPARALPRMRPAARPRYARLAELLQGEIRSGRLGIGARVPGELDLVERYGVSRHTVREALRRLSDQGLIVRRRGAGTVVTACTPRERVVQVVHSPSELMSYPPESRLFPRASGLVAMDEGLARLAGCGPGDPWFRVQALRRLGPRGAAIAWSDIYLRPEFADVAAEVGRHAGPLYELLETRHGQRVAQVDVDIRAGLLGPERSAALGVDAGAAALAVLRRYRDASGRCLQVTVAEHPAELFTYSFALRRGEASGPAWIAG